MSAVQTAKKTVQKRPAEIGTPVAAAVGLLIAKAVGVTDPATIGSITVVVAFTPAAITWLVTLTRG